jgi:hypothetical protein
MVRIAANRRPDQPAGRVAGAPPARKPASGFAVHLATATFALLVARVVIPAGWGPDSEKYNLSDAAALLNKVTWLAFLAVSAVLVLARSPAALRLIRGTNPFFIALLAFAAGSALWSIDPGATVARMFHVLTIFLCCAAVTLVGWHQHRFQETLRPVFTLLLVGSLIFGLIAPDLAIEAPIPPDTKYSWHGLADQKNQLGALASMGVLLWLHGWASREVKAWPALLWGSACAACLLLSRSSTSLMATILVGIFVLLQLRTNRTLRRFMPYAIGIFAAITITYSMAVLRVVPAMDILLEPIVLVTGKDTTFSNRTEIWAVLREHIALSPALGSGYGAYWTGPQPTSPSYIFFSRMFFYPGECHNGYLEVINDLGYAGLLLLLGYLWRFLRGSLRLLRIDYSQGGLYIAMLFQQLLTNLSESHWLFISADLIMFTLATLCMVRSAASVPARTGVRRAGQQPVQGTARIPIRSP